MRRPDAGRVLVGGGSADGNGSLYDLRPDDLRPVVGGFGVLLAGRQFSIPGRSAR